MKNKIIIILLIVIIILLAGVLSLQLQEKSEIKENNTVNNTTNNTTVDNNTTVPNNIENNDNRYVIDENGVYDTVTGRYAQGQQYEGSTKEDVRKYQQSMVEDREMEMQQRNIPDAS